MRKSFIEIVGRYGRGCEMRDKKEFTYPKKKTRRRIPCMKMGSSDPLGPRLQRAILSGRKIPDLVAPSKRKPSLHTVQEIQGKAKLTGPE